jgi:hypothetical protein
MEEEGTATEEGKEKCAPVDAPISERTIRDPAMIRIERASKGRGWLNSAVVD